MINSKWNLASVLGSIGDYGALTPWGPIPSWSHQGPHHPLTSTCPCHAWAGHLLFSHCCCCCWVASVVSDSVRPHRQQPPGSPVPGILQARILEWVSISFSSAWKWKVKVKSLSRVRLLATSWTAAHQAPPSMGFSRQEYWSGVPLPSPKNEASGTHKYQKVRFLSQLIQAWYQMFYSSEF